MLLQVGIEPPIIDDPVDIDESESHLRPLQIHDSENELDDGSIRADSESLVVKDKELIKVDLLDFDSSTFLRSACDRGAWLSMLLIFQSFSSIILSRNVDFIRDHPTVLYFLTALVGAGGNAGNQAAVRCIRGLALKKLNHNNISSFLLREMWMALILSGILGIVGLGRAYFSSGSRLEMVAIVVSLVTIVMVSVLIGAALPLLLQKVGADPAHASTTIQVLMDILGVYITICVAVLLLDSNFTNALTRAFSPGADLTSVDEEILAQRERYTWTQP